MTGIFWCRLKAGREDTGNNVVGLLISCVTILYLQSPALVLSGSFFLFRCLPLARANRTLSYKNAFDRH